MRPITRADNGQLLTIDAEDGYIFSAEDLDDGNSIRVENTSGTHYDNPFVFTNFYQTRVNYGAGVKKRTISGPFPMPDGATYRFDITEQSQGNKAMLVTVESSGGGTGGADTTARALAKAATDRLDQIYPGSGKIVTPGSTVSILTTDAGIVIVDNPTGNDIAVPATPTKADVLATGLVEHTAANPTVNHFDDLAVVTGRNVIADLQHVPITKPIWVVNGVEARTGITVNSQTVTVDANVLGYNLEPNFDTVHVSYDY